RRDDRSEAARGGDAGALDEDLWRVCVELIPPPEEGRRRVDGERSELEPGGPELGLEGELPGGPLRRAPGGREHDGKDDEDRAPEDAGCRHGRTGSARCGLKRKQGMIGSVDY